MIRTGEGIIGEQDGKVTLLGPGPHPFKRNASGWVFVVKVQSEHLLLLEVILTSLAIFEGRRAERIPATSHNKSKLLHVDTTYLFDGSPDSTADLTYCFILGFISETFFIERYFNLVHVFNSFRVWIYFPVGVDQKNNHEGQRMGICSSLALHIRP